MKHNIQYFFDEQLKIWNFARENYRRLEHLKIKTVAVNGCEYKIQHNPHRQLSTEAKVNQKSIESRECFLCEKNRFSEQMKIVFNKNYSILVNPYPIFSKHFTIATNEHLAQSILDKIGDMLDLTKTMGDCVVFYNGPKCGASASYHAHFQAVSKGFLPLQNQWKNHTMETPITNLSVIRCPFPAFVVSSEDKKESEAIFKEIYLQLSLFKNAQNIANDLGKVLEPMMNILAWRENGKYVIIVIPRAKHRPNCYFDRGDDNISISPASVDLGGVFIVPLQKDFEKLTVKNIKNILNEVCLSENDFQQIIEKLLKK